MKLLFAALILFAAMSGGAYAKKVYLAKRAAITSVTITTISGANLTTVSGANLTTN